MSFTASLFLAVVLASLCSCRSAPSGGDGFRTVSIGYQTGIVGVESRGARNEADWRKLWAEHTSTQIPRPAAPRIDFAKEMVIAVFAGEKPTGGYGIEVEKADFNGTHLVLTLHETAPSEDAIVPMVVTRPYHMIATPLTNASFKIERRTVPGTNPPLSAAKVAGSFLAPYVTSSSVRSPGTT